MNLKKIMDKLRRETPVKRVRRLAREGLTNYEITEETTYDHVWVKQTLRNYRAKVKNDDTQNFTYPG